MNLTDMAYVRVLLTREMTKKHAKRSLIQPTPSVQKHLNLHLPLRI